MDIFDMLREEIIDSRSRLDEMERALDALSKGEDIYYPEYAGDRADTAINYLINCAGAEPSGGSVNVPHLIDLPFGSRICRIIKLIGEEQFAMGHARREARHPEPQGDE